MGNKGKQPEHEAEDFSLSSAEVKNVYNYTYSPNTYSWWF
jgi:hypothetical protein